MITRRLISTGAVGVDICADCIKLLQLRDHADGPRVVGAARIEFSAPGDDSGNKRQTEQLHAVISSGRFTGRRCVVSLPREDTKIQAVRMAAMPDNELAEAVRWEASQRFNMPATGLQSDFLRTGATLAGSENREEVLIIAASHDVIRARVQPLIDAGFRPMAIDVASSALARVFSRNARRDADKDIVRAVLEVGYRGSMVIVLRGNQIAFCKPIDIGGWHFNDAVSSHLQIERSAAAELRKARIRAAAGGHGRPSGDTRGADDQTIDASTDRALYESVRPLVGELTKELTLCLRYYGVTFRGAPPSRVILTGAEALEPKLCDAIAPAAKIPVALDDETDTLSGIGRQIAELIPHEHGSAPDWSIAAGLSMRGFPAARSEKRVAAATRTRASEQKEAA